MKTRSRRPIVATTMDKVYFDSPIGLLRITANKTGITRIDYPNQKQATAINCITSNPHLTSAVTELEHYFGGSLKHFSTSLAAEGTPFQLSVWKELSKIPYGATASYGDIAERIENTGASQAVGMANNRNPISIIVPCHRVIGRNGKLVGYGGGIWRKEWLLKHEGILL